MSSEKTERLVNLTLGLLASKRYLTKNEIFRTISGYSGTPESMERMFERDKDELRAAGIVIEVGGLDPLFEDEQGYLIRSSQIQIQPNDFSKQELILMVLAANYWMQSNMTDSAKNALLKIASIDSALTSASSRNTGQLSIQGFNHNFEQVRILIHAVASRQYIRFNYKSIERNVAPIRLENKEGYWYLSAVENDALKQYKVIRFESSVALIGDEEAFNKTELLKGTRVEKNPDANDQRLKAHIRIGKCNNLRKGALISGLDSEWEEIELQFTDAEQMIRDLLWNGDDVKVYSPKTLINEMIMRLQKVIV